MGRKKTSNHVGTDIKVTMKPCFLVLSSFSPSQTLLLCICVRTVFFVAIERYDMSTLLDVYTSSSVSFTTPKRFDLSPCSQTHADTTAIHRVHACAFVFRSPKPTNRSHVRLIAVAVSSNDRQNALCARNAGSCLNRARS